MGPGSGRGWRPTTATPTSPHLHRDIAECTGLTQADPERVFGWTENAVQYHRIAIEPHLIAVGTARADWVEVMIREHVLAPSAEIADAVHVVEADLDAPSGELSVFGPTDDRGAEHRFTVASGSYRVRVSYVAADPPQAGFDEDEPGDHFRYVADLWSSAGVLRQGPVPWAGRVTTRG